MGKVIMSGIVPTLKAPVTGVLASSLAVGSTVKLMEGGTAVEYLVVNQGIPSNSSLYDASCDGIWLLRKDCFSKSAWNTTAAKAQYADSSINTWQNNNFYGILGSVEKATIKQVKIPYCDKGTPSGTVQSGENGLSTKIFLLSSYEVGFSVSDYPYISVDGAKLDYFESGISTSASNKRTAKWKGSKVDWWLRSPNILETYNNRNAMLVKTDGSYSTSSITSTFGVRPAMIIPSNALFDKNTMLLKGVK